MKTRRLMQQFNNATNRPLGLGNYENDLNRAKTHQENLQISDPRPFCNVKTVTVMGKASKVYQCVIYCPRILNSARNSGVILAKPFILAGIWCISQRKLDFYGFWWWADETHKLVCFSIEKRTFFPVQSSISAIAMRIWRIANGNFTKWETCDRRNLVL